MRRYRLELIAMPCDSCPPARRLRAVLKRLLRTHGLRCDRIEEVRDEMVNEKTAVDKCEEVDSRCSICGDVATPQAMENPHDSNDIDDKEGL